MRSNAVTPPKAVVVHAGARDSYQVVRAIDDANLLERFVTNVYVRKWISEHYNISLQYGKVKVPVKALLAFIAMRACRDRDLHSWSDRILSRTAGRIAIETNAALLCYSYYGYDAFVHTKESIAHRLLFQLHPHPVSVRRILLEEIERVPFAGRSLRAEPDVSREGVDFERLAEEPTLASGVIVASTYTRQTLVENGVASNHVEVIPYGVDSQRYPARRQPPPRNGPMTIIWLGQLTQRKGLSYFLEAIRRVSGRHLRVVIRGRGQVDRKLLDSYRDVKCDLGIGLPRAQVVHDLQQSHLYVLPSLVEGFGQTILEAMSCGLPVLASNHTCAPDVITPGKEGFIVGIRDTDAIAEKLDWCLSHRVELEEMGQQAAVTAGKHNWSVFRSRVIEAYRRMTISR